MIEVDGAVPSPPLTYPADVQLVLDYESSGGPVTSAPIPVTPDNWLATPWASIGIGPPVQALTISSTEWTWPSPSKSTSL